MCFIICYVFRFQFVLDILDLEVRVREFESTQDPEQEVVLDDHEREANHARVARVSVNLDRAQFLDRRRGLDLVRV